MDQDKELVRCKRCNRVLKTTEALSRGYGEHCWKLHIAEVVEKDSLFQPYKYKIS